MWSKNCNLLCWVFFTALLWYGCKVTRSSITISDQKITPSDIQPNLSKTLKESSGLISWDEALWTINDGGSTPAIYKLNPTDGSIQDSVNLKGVTNQDWESITHDDDYIYIGEFGNNLGLRKNLSIYKISKSQIITKQNLQIDSIEFHYPQQDSFPGTYDHNFDAEAFLSFGDSLYIFTKNWLNQECVIYTLPKQPGSYPARRQGSFDTKGVVTGATANNKETVVTLVGYNFNKATRAFSPFVWEFSNFKNGNIFTGAARRNNLESKRQVEAIAWSKKGEYWITAEKTFAGEASLFGFKLD